MSKFLAKLLLLIMVIPVITVFVFSFQDYNTPKLPLGRISTRWYGEFLNGTLVASIRTSFKTAILTAILATALAWITADVERRWNLSYPNWVIFLAFLPCLLPPLVLGFALKGYFSVIGVPDGLFATVLAHGAFCAPIAFAIIRSGYESITQSVIGAAYNLGASTMEMTKVAIIPQIAAPIVACLLLTFLFSWTEFSIAWYIGGMDQTFAVAIRTRMASNITPEVYAASAVSLGFAILFVLLAGKLVVRGMLGRWNRA